MTEKLDMSFYLRPYRTVPGLDLDGNRDDLEFLTETARMIRPITDESYKGLPGYNPYNPNDFFLDSFDAGCLPRLKSEIRRAGQRIAAQIAHRLGWDERMSHKDFDGITWTLFHTDLRSLAGRGLNVGRWHGDKFTANLRGLWVSQGAAALELVCPKDQEGVAYCTQVDDFERIAAFAESSNNRIVSVRGNSISETTEDMVHRREEITAGSDMNAVQYAMRIHWPG